MVKIILNRLTGCAESQRGLSAIQFGFLMEKTTVDTASKKMRRSDLNAFSSVIWITIAVALHSMRVPD